MGSLCRFTPGCRCCGGTRICICDAKTYPAEFAVKFGNTPWHDSDLEFRVATNEHTQVITDQACEEGKSHGCLYLAQANGYGPRSDQGIKLDKKGGVKHWLEFSAGALPGGIVQWTGTRDLYAYCALRMWYKECVPLAGSQAWSDEAYIQAELIILAGNGTSIAYEPNPAAVFTDFPEFACQQVRGTHPNEMQPDEVDIDCLATRELAVGEGYHIPGNPIPPLADVPNLCQHYGFDDYNNILNPFVARVCGFYSWIRFKKTITDVKRLINCGQSFHHELPFLGQNHWDSRHVCHPKKDDSFAGATCEVYNPAHS